jgi:hypothetical protein
MRTKQSDRGFTFVTAEKYQSERGHFTRLISESSQIGDYEDSFDKPGSSALWVGDDHHLNREEVHELIGRLQHWLDTGRLQVDPPPNH